VIFLVDPLYAHPHEPDINGLLRICNVYNVPLATNEATGHLMLDGLVEKLDAEDAFTQENN
jgi:methylglyoxal synthase